jgi:hypothetical protein
MDLVYIRRSPTVPDLALELFGFGFRLCCLSGDGFRHARCGFVQRSGRPLLSRYSSYAGALAKKPFRAFSLFTISAYIVPRSFRREAISSASLKPNHVQPCRSVRQSIQCAKCAAASPGSSTWPRRR